MLSFDVADADAARRVETSTTLIGNATSLGGVDTTIEGRFRWEGDRVPPGLLRLSVGLEDVGRALGRPRAGARAGLIEAAPPERRREPEEGLEPTAYGL